MGLYGSSKPRPGKAICGANHARNFTDRTVLRTCATARREHKHIKFVRFWVVVQFARCAVNSRLQFLSGGATLSYA